VYDLSHYFGNDIAASPTGDLAPIDGVERGKQRILRRLLTNPGDYVWNPTYGAGLPQYIGQPLDSAKIQALILGQMRLEACVAQSPAPDVSVQAIPQGLSVSISYLDASSKTTQLLSFSVTN
jgi:hypothetical protein